MQRMLYPIQALLFLLGVVLMALGAFTHEAILSVGASLTASSFVAYVTYNSIERENRLKRVAREWGLSEIYNTRSEINTKSTDYMTRSRILDIAAYGLRSFRDAKTELLRKSLRRGLHLRILSIQPEAKIVSLIDIDEGAGETHTRDSIVALQNWVHKLQEEFPNQVELRFYDSLPMEFYFRYSQALFVGPHHKKSSQQTLTYEYNPNGKASEVYDAYFQEAWEAGEEG